MENFNMDYYKYWEESIKNWFHKLPLGTWTNPDETPLYNNRKTKVLSSNFIPEPWWGNHDADVPLHSVVVNYNPGEGGDLQLSDKFPHFTSYAQDVVDSGHLPKTAEWHFNKRAKPILNSLIRIGAIPKSYVPSLSNHLSIELMPWHTKYVNSNFAAYFNQNISNVYKYGLCFAAHESQRIANNKLRNVVILKMSGKYIHNLLKELKVIGNPYCSSIQTVQGTTSHFMEFSIDTLAGIRFACIWGEHAMNNFPKGADIDYMLTNYI